MERGSLLHQYKHYELQCESEYILIDDNKDVLPRLPDDTDYDYDSAPHLYLDDPREYLYDSDDLFDGDTDRWYDDGSGQPFGPFSEDYVL